MSLEEVVRKHALKNAFDHHGRAEVKAVVSKIMAEEPSARTRAKEILSLVGKVTTEVNTLDISAIHGELEEKYPELLVRVKKVQEHRLPDLKNVRGKVVMRMAPSPSGPLHIGHSRMAILNDEYVKRYGGELILRLEDTNADNIDPFAYEQIPRDLEWLGVKVTRTVIQSDRLAIYYDEARKLIGKGHMYVCHCDRESFKNSRQQGIACPHRESDPAGNLEAFDMMVAGKFSSGEAVAVLKTDMKHQNPSVRDWIAFRIGKSRHPRTGENIFLFPTMNFSVAVDDHLLGLTHVIRGTDHISNTDKQSYIYSYNGWTPPEYFHYGFISIPDAIMKTSIIKQGIVSGRYKGWDDVQLHTLMAMKRRGYSPETFRRYWIESGLRVQNATFSWEIFNSMNRENVDSGAKRLFFVTSPVKIRIGGGTDMRASIPFHPEHRELGTRDYELGSDPEVFVSSDDLDSVVDGGILRLKDLCNLRRNGNSFELEQGKDISLKSVKIVQWCPADSPDFKVLRPDGSTDTGVIEPLHSSVRGISQFERYGYVRLEKGYALFLHN